MSDEITKSPHIRFVGFTKNWEQRKLGEEFYKVNERNDGSFSKEHWISVAKMYFQDPEKVTSNNIDTRTYVMRLGDIAFEGNKSKRFKYGRFVANDIGDGVVSELFPIYRHKQEYDNDFWKRAIQLERMMAPIFAKSITSSGTSSNKLDEKHFLRQFISVPELSEQKQIGSFFKKLDNIIMLHQRRLELLKVTKESLIQNMFPKEGKYIPRIRFAEFTNNWEQCKLFDVAEIVSGGTPSTTNREYWDGDIDWYAPAEINNQIYVDGSERKITELGLQKSSAKILPADRTVLFTSRASIGKMAILRKQGATNQGFQSIVLDDKTNSYFVYSMGSIIKKKAEKVASGSTFPEISGKILGNLKFIFTNKDEQDKIGECFSNFDYLIALHKRELDLLENLKKSMLQQMFI